MTGTFRNSAFERNENDAYYTEPWVTRALLRVCWEQIQYQGTVWEPACGPGHMAREILGSRAVYCSDINPELPLDILEHDNFKGSDKIDFLGSELDWMDQFVYKNDIGSLITNPPFGKLAEKFVRRALEMRGISFVAMLLRTDFNHAGGYTDLFTDAGNHFAYEVVLTSRPRWDWWMTPEQKRAAKIAAGKDPDGKDHGPMHNFSWFVWDQAWQGPSTQFWQGRTDDGTDDL